MKHPPYAWAFHSFAAVTMSFPRKMKWGMEVEETEAVLEKIWDLHDKLSDAIHSISRAHFLNSAKPPKIPGNKNKSPHDAGSVFMKDFRLDDDDSVKSLNAIRTALENFEDQLEFFHTIQMQQEAERDVAVARLEQSRIVLAMRLAEHRGKKYQVIDEARAFVGDVQDAVHFVSPKNIYGQQCSPGENFASDTGKKSNILINLFLSSFTFVKKSLRLVNMGGIVGNAALVALSMVALLHFQHATYQEHPHGQESRVYNNRTGKKPHLLKGSSSNTRSSNLDVLLARG